MKSPTEEEEQKYARVNPNLRKAGRRERGEKKKKSSRHDKENRYRIYFPISIAKNKR